MRTKITLVLIFMNVALFAFIFYIEPRFRTEEALHALNRRVLGPEAANIVALEISGRQYPRPLRIERHGDLWFLSSPAGWPANPNAVSRILTELQTLDHETSFLVSDLAKNGQTLADYGLDHPRLTLTFTAGSDGSSAAKNYTLRIGADTRIGNHLYLLSADGKRIHVVGDSLAECLTLPPDQLRSDRFFTIPVFEARALSLQAAGPPVRIRRDGARWSFESPFIARASRTYTELVINDLGTLEAQSFPDPRDADPDRTGLAAPGFRITLDGNNRRETLLLGNPAPAGTASAGAKTPAAETLFYAKMDDKPAVFTVSLPNGLLDRLKNAQVTLRETRFLDFDPQSVTSITLRAPNFPELTLQRLESSAPAKDTSPWQIVRRTAAGPQTEPADLPITQHLLETLSLLTARQFVSDAPSAADLEAWGFNRPEREIVLTLPPAGTRPRLLTLQIGLGADSPDHVYARVAGSDSVYAVDPEILAATPVVPRMYRDRLLRALPDGAQITGLKLTRLADKAVLCEKALAAPADAAGKPASWDSVLAGEPAGRRQAIQTLLTSLRTLRAKRFVLDEFSPDVIVAGENRPWSYRLDATIALAAASGAPATTATTRLFFSERAGGGTQLAGSAEFGVVFEAEQPLLDALFFLTTPPPDQTPANNPAGAK